LSDKSLSLSVEAALSKVWGIAQTFVFITFTRLFFRSGSNLDPAEANRVAWETAVNMIEQIGGAWDVEIIPQVIQSYAAVFVLFILGMIIHWLPQNWKRRYRLAFAKLPIACMVLVVVAVVFFVYQFITADLQAFIYFQF
ncbi:MAG: MBOAT family protein, partial [Bacteroidales bacterium]|nr:MBOAT family protein [Bacteroidales bacterium]